MKDLLKGQIYRLARLGAASNCLCEFHVLYTHFKGGVRHVTHTPFEVGVQYMEFTEAVTRSAQSGQAIYLPL